MSDCKNCYGDEFDKTRVDGPCKVCEILDGDMAVKITHYCNTCEAYMCDPCRSNPIRRGEAVALNFGRKVIEVVKDIVSSILPNRQKNEKEFATDEFSKEDQA